jgi:hypothetical protein
MAAKQYLVQGVQVCEADDTREYLMQGVQVAEGRDSGGGGGGSSVVPVIAAQYKQRKAGDSYGKTQQSSSRSGRSTTRPMA